MPTIKKEKSEASILQIKAPKSTYEKNICLFLKRSENQSTISAITEKFNEREIIIRQLLDIMKKGGLVNIDGENVYLNIILQG